MINESLDLTGIPCPTNAARALIKISTMMPGEIIELILDAGEPLDNVPAALDWEGHKILESSQISDISWRLLVEVA